MTALHFHRLQVREVRADADKAVVVTLDVPAELCTTFVFEPGQYLTLRKPGGELRRSYSICSAPGENLRVGVRKLVDGAFSPWVHDELRAGDAVDVMPPQGRFGHALAQATQEPQQVLLVAGGSGITPILSILRTLLTPESSTHCTLLYGNRRMASTMFKEELEDLKNRFMTRLSLHPVFSREQVDAPLSAGRLDRARIALFLRTLVNPAKLDHAFICGPHALNDEAEAALLEAGVAADRIHVERFGIPPAQRQAQEAGPQSGDPESARVTLLRDGLTREFGFSKSDASILDAAARAGLDVPYSCKSGVCATCRAKLLDGQVRMDRNFALEKADLDAGFILTCQAHPLTPRVTVSFDDR